MIGVQRKGPKEFASSQVSIQSCTKSVLILLAAVTIVGNVAFFMSNSKSHAALPRGTVLRSGVSTVDGTGVRANPQHFRWIDGDGIPLVAASSSRSHEQIRGVGLKELQPSRAPPAKQQQNSGPLDWSLKTPENCDGYFGNGYSAFFSLITPTGDTSSNGAEDVFELERVKHYAACRTHPAIEATYCTFRNLIVYPSRITMAAGGETMDKVLGQDESAELPQFKPAAFEIVNGPLMALEGFYESVDVVNRGEGRSIGEAVRRTTLIHEIESRDSFKLAMLDSIRFVETRSSKQAYRGCERVVTEPVIFVTRVEYANLFHTTTDWYNAWQVANVVGLHPTMTYDMASLFGLTEEMRAYETAHPRVRAPRISAHIIFLDGHSASPMDDGWLSLFLSINYVKHLGKVTCFSSSIYAPYGYHASLSQGIQPKLAQCFGNPHIRAYGEDFVSGLALTPRTAPPCNEANTPVLFIRRVHYLAHPRHDGKIVRRLQNEDEIFEYLDSMSSVYRYSLVNGVFSSMSMREQAKAVQEACVVMGAHGAGLSHVLLAAMGAHVLELRPPDFMRPHFIAYAHWAGVMHHDWAMSTNSPAPTDVLEHLTTVLEAARTR